MGDTEQQSSLLTDAEKELLIQAVDNAKSIEDLLSVAAATILAN